MKKALLLGFAAIALLIVLSGCTDENDVSVPSHNEDALHFESVYYTTDSHQVNLTFSIFNAESEALTNVVVEAFLLDPGQDPSVDFTYLDHEQITIGTVNSGEKTTEYSLVLGEEKLDYDYNVYTYMKASSAEGDSGTTTSDVFTIFAYSYLEYYEKTYCPKIDPYNLEVRKAASEAVRAHPGEYGIDQLLDIYDWIKVNINYLNVPVMLPSTPYVPSETLATRSGDCKNQAVLIASMAEAIGGRAKVVAEPSCSHAYTIVYITDDPSEVQSYIDIIAEHYFPCEGGFMCGGECWNYSPGTGAWCDGSTATESDWCSPGQVGFTDDRCHFCPSGQTLILEEGGGKCSDSSDFSVNFFNYEDESWFIFDPAGGNYPGNTIEECLSDENAERYFIEGCVEPPE